MAWDIVVTESCKIFLTTDRPLPAAPASLAYLRAQRLLRLDFVDGTDELMEYELDPQLDPQIVQAEDALIVEIDARNDVNGFRIPLHVQG